MRLQGAIFDFHGTILDDKETPCPVWTGSSP